MCVIPLLNVKILVITVIAVSRLSALKNIQQKHTKAFVNVNRKIICPYNFLKHTKYKNLFSNFKIMYWNIPILFNYGNNSDAVTIGPTTSCGKNDIYRYTTNNKIIWFPLLKLKANTKRFYKEIIIPNNSNNY